MKVQARKEGEHTSGPEAANGKSQKRSIERLQWGLIVIHV